jgi:LPXTG-motif cell wall-anchored protein
VLTYLDYEKNAGRRHPEWESRIRTVLDRFLLLQGEDGSFPRKFSDALDVKDPSGGSTSSAVLPLAMGYRYFRDRDYLAAAELAAGYLEKELIAKAEAMDLNGYNEASVGAFRSALAAAQAVLADESLTEDDQAKVDTAVMNLLTAMENLTAEGEMPTQQPSQTPAPTTQPDDGKVPQTGDTMNVAAYLFTAVVCAAGLAVLAIFRKKNA